MAAAWGVKVSYDWQCQHCGAPIGPRDRVCLSCERAAGPAGPAPGLQRLVPAQTSCAQASHGPALRPGWYVPPPRLPGDAA
jgi:hypothetical protein